VRDGEERAHQQAFSNNAVEHRAAGSSTLNALMVSTPVYIQPVIFMLAFRSAMTEIGQLERLAWAGCFALQAGLMLLLLVRRNHIRFPAFTCYLAGSLVQNVVQFALYRHWGFASQFANVAAWSVQGVVSLLRTLAVLEVCYRVFSRYRGIWTLIWRTLLICVMVIACLAMTMGDRSFELRILYADRAVGLAVAFVVVALLLFSRYYRVPSEEPARSIAVGFFLYSCFVVLNDTVLERLPVAYYTIWNFMGTVAFTASVLVWGWALRHPTAETTADPEMLPASVYKELSPEVNLRLRMLNDRLSRLSRGEEQGP
jgi:hypothetical protein